MSGSVPTAPIVRRTARCLLVASFAVCISSSGNAQTTNEARAHRMQAVGRVHFEVATNAPAAAAFDHAIALLHSFEYSDAADPFRLAQRRDPALALAYYGEALTYRHALWGEEDLASARAALGRLAPTAAERLAHTPAGRDRGFAAAVEALYAEGPERARVYALADSMRALSARYPDDDEVQAFTAIALLGATKLTSDSSALTLRLRAAALAEHVLARNPEHPGAAHYIIHAYDTPALAERGRGAAARYASVAPASEHALHMPSHIFLQLGRWREVERSNVAANAASRAWVRSHHFGTERRDLHVMDWLVYSLVQQGRIKDARVALDSIAHIVAHGEFTSNDYLGSVDLGEVAAMYFAWDGGLRSAIVAPRPRAFAAYVEHPRASASSPELWAFYAQSLDAAWRGDTGVARANALALNAFADTNTAGPVRWYRTMAIQLDAMALATRGDTAGAVATLRDATERQKTLPVWAGTYWGIPAGEMLGSLLYSAGRYAEAADAFSAALALRHNAAAPLLGRARALWAAGDLARAREDYRQLRETWRAADAQLPALMEVRSRAR